MNLDSHDPVTSRPRRRPPAIWQPRQPLFWLTAVLVIVCGVAQTRAVFVGAQPDGALAALIFVGIQAVLLWLILRALPRFPVQPTSIKLVALTWGLFVAALFAAFANRTYISVLPDFGLNSFSASIAAPINEDWLRLLGVYVALVFARRLQSLTVMDGVVYGFIVGCGFELIENLSYALDGEDLSDTLSTGVLRLVFGFGTHALWTTIGGAMLAYCMARKQRGLSGRWLLLIPAVIAPMFFHALWDAPELSISPYFKLALLFVLYVATLVLFFISIAMGRRAEWDWISTTGPYSDLTKPVWKTLPQRERKRIKNDVRQLNSSTFSPHRTTSPRESAQE